MRIEDLRPFYTLVVMGDEKWYEMAWCHEAIVHAVAFYRALTGDHLTLSELIEKATTDLGNRALCYGAMRARAPINVDTFDRIYSYKAGVFAVSQGLTGYLPTRTQEQVMFGELDEAYPEVIQGKNDGELDMGPSYRALRRLGYTVNEIMQMTWDGTSGALDIEGGGKDWEEPWQESTVAG